MSPESKLARRHRVQRIGRRLIAYPLDLAAFALSTFLAFELRFDGALPAQYFHPFAVALCIWAVAKSASFIVGAVNRGSWRHTSVHDAVRIVLAVSTGSMLGGLVIFLLVGPWLAQGWRPKGVAGCGKHFPGLGGGTLDSHLETPKIERTWQQLWQEDLEPYRALRSQLPMIMVNHAAYPLTADPVRPATVSKFWMQTVLRKRIGYRGIVVSDDLEMGGVTKFMPIAEAAIATVRMGADLALICHHPEPILQAYEALIREGERSAAFSKILLERARESVRKRAKTFPAKMPTALNPKQFEALRVRILRFGDTVAKAAAQETA